MAAKSYLAGYMWSIFSSINALRIAILVGFIVVTMGSAGGHTNTHSGRTISDRFWADTTGIVADTAIGLDPVHIRAFLDRQTLMRTTASAAVLDLDKRQMQTNTTLVPALNTVPGVRMEERSPGSYRLSVRGSLLRSPFGVRNVKVYMDEIPLTDAGGNTYLNLLDPGAVSSVEILKGPDGSLFGANSGGVMVFTPDDPRYTRVRIQGGAYGLFHQQLSTGATVSDQYRFMLQQSYQRSDGYRDHTGLQKYYFQTQHHWNYHPGKPNQIRVLALYGDLDYRTPGGLTRAQYEENPRSARPPTPTTPGAEEQRAGIRNRTVLGGLTHEWHPSAQLRHVASLFGSYTDFHNPFITNYEMRFEHNLGLRTYLSYRLPIQDSDWSTRMQVGAEWQQGRYAIHNFDNHAGRPGASQAADQIAALSGTTFVRIETDYRLRWVFEGALSRNRYANRFKAPGSQPDVRYQLPVEWMPRLAVSYRPVAEFVWRAVLSKGFSPPTIAEIRPSDNIVNIDLKAESGWNLETGLRMMSRDRRYFADLSLFRYRLRDALVRGSRQNGAEYFRNAGSIGQFGLELALNAQLIDRTPDIARYPRLEWTGSWAWSNFKFLDYRTDNQEFSGNALTGVPRHTLMNAVSFLTPDGWKFHVMHQFVATTPLDDANTVYADSYHLLQTRFSRTFLVKKPAIMISVFVSADNLLNQRYSLGNDINAFGGRYFNVASGRNAYGGVSLQF